MREHRPDTAGTNEASPTVRPAPCRLRLSEGDTQQSLVILVSWGKRRLKRLRELEVVRRGGRCAEGEHWTPAERSPLVWGETPWGWVIYPWRALRGSNPELCQVWDSAHSCWPEGDTLSHARRLHILTTQPTATGCSQLALGKLTRIKLVPNNLTHQDPAINNKLHNFWHLTKNCQSNIKMSPTTRWKKQYKETSKWYRCWN